MACHRKKSQVWEYFIFFFNQEAVVNKTIRGCKICKCKFKYATGLTSLMISNLSLKHGIVVKCNKVAVNKAQ